jgi:hypothetical protein
MPSGILFLLQDMIVFRMGANEEPDDRVLIHDADRAVVFCNSG